MTKRTALNIADTIINDLHRFPERKEAAEMIRSQHAEIESASRRAEFWKAEHLAGNIEIERLTKQNSAYSTLVKSQEAQLSILREKVDEHQTAVAMIDSERAANERLTAEIARLRSIVEDCVPYLKDGELPADRIRRDIRDNDALLSLLAEEKEGRKQMAKDMAMLRSALVNLVGTDDENELQNARISRSWGADHIACIDALLIVRS